MNRLVNILLVVFLGSLGYVASVQAQESNDSHETYTEPSKKGMLNVASFNILWDKYPKGYKQWELRKVEGINIMERHNPDLIGGQEFFLNQAEDMASALGFAYVAYGSNDGKSEAESPADKQTLNPIFYNPERLEVLDRGVFWYSDKTDTPNRGYSTGSKIDNYNRFCVWAKFTKKDGSNKTFYVFNTHWSTDELVKKRTAVLMNKMMKEIAGEESIILAIGDFNSDEVRDDSYEIFLEQETGLEFTDVQKTCKKHEGPNCSDSGLIVDSGKEFTVIVDHIFTHNVKKCIRYKVIADYKGKYYPSDHFPVMAVLKF
ncbi:MAG: hypothetical protein ACK5L5_01550 [Bacteroidales bacterium]